MNKIWWVVIGVIALALFCGWRPFQKPASDGTVTKPPAIQPGHNDL